MKRTLTFPLPKIRRETAAWFRVTDFGVRVEDFKLGRIALDRLIGTQPSVTIKGLASTDWHRPIYVVIIGRKAYIRDGHHRVVRSLMRNRKTIKAYILKLEAA